MPDEVANGSCCIGGLEDHGRRFEGWCDTRRDLAHASTRNARRGRWFEARRHESPRLSLGLDGAAERFRRRLAPSEVAAISCMATCAAAVRRLIADHERLTDVSRAWLFLLTHANAHRLHRRYATRARACRRDRRLRRLTRRADDDLLIVDAERRALRRRMRGDLRCNEITLRGHVSASRAAYGAASCVRRGSWTNGRS